MSGKEFYIEQQKVKYIEKLRQESVKDIIKDNKHIFKNNKFNLRLVISPRDYPIEEMMDFNPYVLTDNLFEIVKREYNSLEEYPRMTLFDPSYKMIHYNNFEPPIPLEQWKNISSNEEANLSFAIKNDGVIYFNYHRNRTDNGKITLNLELLGIKLRILFTEIISQIYNLMNYTDKLRIEMNSFGLNHCQIIGEEFPVKFFGLREEHTEFKHQYVLNLQDPINISTLIIRDLRQLFEF
jgi:hypothetical protein